MICTATILDFRIVQHARNSDASVTPLKKRRQTLAQVGALLAAGTRRFILFACARGTAVTAGTAVDAGARITAGVVGTAAGVVRIGGARAAGATALIGLSGARAATRTA